MSRFFIQMLSYKFLRFTAYCRACNEDLNFEMGISSCKARRFRTLSVALSSFDVDIERRRATDLCSLSKLIRCTIWTTAAYHPKAAGGLGHVICPFRRKWRQITHSIVPMELARGQCQESTVDWCQCHVMICWQSLKMRFPHQILTLGAYEVRTREERAPEREFLDPFGPSQQTPWSRTWTYCNLDCSRSTSCRPNVQFRFRPLLRIFGRYQILRQCENDPFLRANENTNFNL